MIEFIKEKGGRGEKTLQLACPFSCTLTVLQFSTIRWQLLFLKLKTLTHLVLVGIHILLPLEICCWEIDHILE